MAQTNALVQEVFQDALKTLGKDVLDSLKARHLAQVERFLKSHPQYNQLLRYLDKIPRHLLPKGKILPTPASLTSFPNARFFRKQIVKVSLNPNSTRYMGTLASSLNGRLTMLKGVATKATWVLPIILGGVSVATAPPEMKMKTLFEQGFGIVFGAIGTGIGGGIVGVTSTMILPLLGICISPLGIFIAAFFLSGYLGYKLFTYGEKIGSNIYNSVDNFSNGRIYHSMEQLFGQF